MSQSVTATPQPRTLRQAIRAALDELGVPGPGYPAPVANAVGILEAALKAEAAAGTLALCGAISGSGPNGEPLACAYPPNPPDQPMHRHSWATLPTFIDGVPYTVEQIARALPYYREGNEATCREDAASIRAKLAEAKPKRTRIDWSNVVIDEGDEAP